MNELLRQKLGLFLVILIMSYCVTAESSSIADASPSYSLHHYFNSGKQAIVSVGSYCQALFHQVIDYFYSFAQSAPAVDDVKIQINGPEPKQDDHVDDPNARYNNSDNDNGNKNLCPAGDIGCLQNMVFFNNTFFTGKANMTDHVAVDIDEYDKEYQAYGINELKLRYGLLEYSPEETI